MIWRAARAWSGLQARAALVWWRVGYFACVAFCFAFFALRPLTWLGEMTTLLQGNDLAMRADAYKRCVKAQACSAPAADPPSRSARLWIATESKADERLWVAPPWDNQGRYSLRSWAKRNGQERLLQNIPPGQTAWGLWTSGVGFSHPSLFKLPPGHAMVGLDGSAAGSSSWSLKLEIFEMAKPALIFGLFAFGAIPMAYLLMINPWQWAAHRTLSAAAAPLREPRKHFPMPSLLVAFSAWIA
jgi:hypothetical protein